MANGADRTVGTVRAQAHDVSTAAARALADALWGPTRHPWRPPGWAGRLLTAGYAVPALYTTVMVTVMVTGQAAAAGSVVVASTLVGGHLLAVLLAARRPLLGWRVELLGLVAGLLLAPRELLQVGPVDLLWHPIGLSLVLAVVGLACPAPVAAAAGALTWAVLLVAGVSVPNATWTLVPLAVTVVLAGRRSARTALAAQRRAAAAAEAQRAVLAERTRIAREMHDVVAHHMSMIAVRCETAPYRLGELPGPVRTELTEVGTAAREAMSEMQALLGVLRADGVAAERAPQPGVAQLAELAAEAREAGADLTCSVTVDPANVPEAVGLSVYRVVQQALTNAGQHARGAPVAVSVAEVSAATGTGTALRIGVTNGPGADGPPGGGHGLVGMRERVELHGGWFHAGPTADGGFAVSVQLPLAPGRPR